MQLAKNSGMNVSLCMKNAKLAHSLKEIRVVLLSLWQNCSAAHNVAVHSQAIEMGTENGIIGIYAAKLMLVRIGSYFQHILVEDQLIEYLSAIQIPQSWREEILAQIIALQPTEEIDLEETAHWLSNAGELLTEATEGELQIIFLSLFQKIYLDHDWAESGYICAVDPTPILYELMSVASLPKLDNFNN